MISAISLILLAVSCVVVTARPTTPTRRAVTPVSSVDLAALAPFTQFARAAYCPTSKLNGWKCGDACNALPGFEPTLIGGDGNGVQIFFVGYWPTQSTVVVAHQGTDPSQLVSDLTDVNVLLDNLDSGLFPGVSSSVEVHDGFRNEQALTASAILAEVKSLMASKNTKNVAVIGHSLGGALAELDALFLALNLPSGTAVKGVTYGTPRVGNPAFAQLIDAKVPDFKRVNNQKDLVPIVPGRFLGYAHPHGEIHIVSPGNAVSCPGDDDAADAQCSDSAVPNIFDGSIANHLGPYEGISIGTASCT